MLFRTMIIAALCLALCGCTHIVIDSKSMVIYRTEECESNQLGKYRYYVRDGSDSGWRFISDSKFSVGDTLKVSKDDMAGSLETPD